MPDIQEKVLLEEQRICVACGMCCDGTLFLHAHLDPGERGSLPGRIEENSYTKDGKDYFRLPCQYFDCKCTIYDKKKANVCSGYRCKLLMDFADNELALDDAIEVVKEAVTMRNQILDQYIVFAGSRDVIYFKKILRELGHIRENALDTRSSGSDYSLLLALCNIFEALLIKHFSPAGEFEKMIMR